MLNRSRLHVILQLCFHVVISCPILDDPMFGSVSYESEEREVGSIASYSCQDHYTLIGATNVTCLETSLWSEGVPTCERE